MPLDSFSLVEHGGKVTNSLGLSRCFSFSLQHHDSPKVSIVIPIYNQLEYTLRCIDSIAKHTKNTSFEVLVVDDCSDLSVYRALSEIPNLRMVRNFKNLGFVRGCNRGVFHARGEYVVLLNNDTEVTAGWLEALLRVFTLYPDAGLAGSKLVYPDGTLQEAGGIIWQDGSGWNFGRNDHPDLPWYNFIRETDYCSGACIMLRREFWESLGGFDLRYVPAYYEDADIAFRVREAGKKVYYQPHSKVIHFEGKSNGTDVGSGIKKHQVENQFRFLERWRGELATHLPNASNVHKARGRGFGKKTILIIDHYIPHWDQDAGSRCIHAYIRLFLMSGMHVQMLGDNFCAHQPYQSQLEEMGVEVLTGTYMQQNWQRWLSENGKHIDYVLFCRAVTSEKWVRPIKDSTKAKLLFYGVDLISRTLLRAYKDFGNPKHLEESKFWQERENYLIHSCEGIFYPSQFEVDELRERFPKKNIEVVPLYLLEPRDRSADLPAKKRDDLLFVGSFAHPPNLDAVDWMLTEVMPALRAKIGPVKLHIVGKNPPEHLLKKAGDYAVFHGYLSDSDLAKLLGTCRVSVAPLRIGGGIKGKILEAFYNGIPVATTKIGIEAIPVGENDCLAVEKFDEFAAELANYYTDFKRLDEVTKRAYESVLNYCSRRSLAQPFAKLIPEVAFD